jgi:hypothetical protein
MFINVKFAFAFHSQRPKAPGIQECKRIEKSNRGTEKNPTNGDYSLFTRRRPIGAKKKKKIPNKKKLKPRTSSAARGSFPLPFIIYTNIPTVLLFALPIPTA